MPIRSGPLNRPRQPEHGPDSMTGRIASFCLSRRDALFWVGVIASLLLATGVFRLGFDSSLDSLLTRSDPYLDELDLLEAEFPQSTEIVFAFLAPEGESVFTRDRLQAIEALRERYLEIPLAGRHSSLLDYYSPRNLRRLFARDFREYGEAELAGLMRTAQADELLTGNLLSNDASLAFTRIRLNAEFADEAQRLDAAREALRVRDALREEFPELYIHVSGEVLIEFSSRQSMLEDLGGLLPFVILACILAICGFFRSVRAGFAILAHTLLTLLCALGTLGLSGFSFNTVTAIAPVIIVVVCVASSVHVISIYRQGLLRGMPEAEAMRFSLMQNIRPVTLAALTTAIGFASLNLSSSPAISDFGSTVAVGIVFSWLLTAALLPSLLIRLIKTGNGSNDGDFLHGAMNQVIAIGRRRDRQLFWFCSAFAAVGISMLPLNETDFNRLDFISDAAGLRDYFDAVGERLDRGPSISYAVDAGARDGAIDPAFLARMEALVDWLGERDEIESTASVVELLKTVNEMRYDDPDAYLLPDDSETIENYLRAYRFVQNLDFPLSNFLSVDRSIAALTVNARPMSNQELIDLNDLIDARFEATFPDADLVHGSGLLVFARMDERVTVELLQGYSLSLALITLTLVFGLGSVYFGILSIIPNLLPAAIVFGFWGLLVGTLDPFVMMLFSISIGLVVDDTVHVLTHYLAKRREGEDIQTAVAHSIRTAGPALTITTLVLTLGTTFLMAASTFYFQQAARLLVPIVVLALLLDVLYLPAILRRFDKFRSPALAS
ncbi:MAG: MMPL family transporter [Gammaproteobacteria bacterium]|nr:MMPL family transporter [Gammaproteobacteria bacterium]MYH86402.1 MMPL family transporter [Gammaproteobacteria bacterium]MYK05763.1 MMPL family transporter [Gammaproteobacteria bacterium]